MKPETSLRILGAIIVVLFVALLLIIIPFVKAYLDKGPESMEEVVFNCSQMSLEESSQCVVKQTGRFYRYNLDGVGKELDFSELKEQGGVCSNWSKYYSELGEQLGFNTENIIIPVSGNIYHEFSVWSNEESYCVLDQTEVMCIELQ